jgi:hypothetical protein
METRASALSGSNTADALQEALPAVDRIRGQLEGAINRRELLKRSAVITAAGVTAMAVKYGPLVRSSAPATTATAATSTAPVPEHAHFMDLVGTTFLATTVAGATPAQRATLTLEEVVLLGDGIDAERPEGLRETPYALRFIVSEGELAPSGIFQLTDKRHQRLDAFIHQVGMRAPGGEIRYEAVFN